MLNATVDSLIEALAIPEGGIASRPLLEVKEGTKLVLFALDTGQEISPHHSPFPAEILSLAGRLTVLVDNTWHELRPSERIELPMGHPHGVRALEPSHFLLTMFRGVQDPAALRAHGTTSNEKDGDPLCTCDVWPYPSKSPETLTPASDPGKEIAR